MTLPLQDLPSPCYVVDTDLLKKNLMVLDRVQERTGAKIILALKGFSMFSTFPLIREHLHGVAASSLNEARLGREEFGREVHVYAPAYKESEFDEYLGLADHIAFNSLSQFYRYRASHKDHFPTVSLEPGTGNRSSVVHGSRFTVQFGLRINPEYSEVKVDLYNPCRPGSRFGITHEQLEGQDLEGVTGLHFHTMCEQNADTLDRTLDVVTEKFGNLLEGMSWVNMGGGHHITRPDYNIDLLCDTIDRFRSRHNVAVYLEPGEAIALNAGFLVTTVLDTFENHDIRVAVLDTSATAHMPDVLEMPYRPEIQGAGAAGKKEYTYRLGGLTCLAGDVIGEYSFDKPLKAGDHLIFEDMAIYTMVKNTLFNGIPLPAIALYSKHKGVNIVREFGYEDYQNRLS